MVTSMGASKLVGARALVTGAGSGLGRAFAQELSRRGARVACADVNLASAEETARRCGADAFALACDVASRSEVQAVADAMDGRWGGADVVINNAGVAVAGSVGTVSETDWSWIVGVNLMGVANGCEVFVPRFKAQARGWVLNVASLAGLIAMPEMGPYNATKYAVVGLSETLRGELHDTGVSVSVLCPAFFRTSILDNGRGLPSRAQKMAERLMDKSPISADDVARIALDGLERGRFYLLPHNESRLLWGVKRFSPGAFVGGVPRVFKKAQGWMR